MRQLRSGGVSIGVVIVIVLVCLGLFLVVTYMRGGGPVGAREQIASNACIIKNLADIQAAKQKWAQESGITNPASPVEVSNLLTHLKYNKLPTCTRSDKPYTIGALGEEPRCPLHGSASQPASRADLIEIRKKEDRGNKQ